MHKDGLRQLHVAVPLLSRRQLAWSGLPERLDLHLTRAGIAPGALEIEIIAGREESLLLARPASGVYLSREALSRLAAHGR